MAFDRKGEWSFGNDFARNLLIFGAGDNSSFHTHSRKKNLLALAEGDTFCIDGSFGHHRKSLVLVFVKQRQNFA